MGEAEKDGIRMIGYFIFDDIDTRNYEGIAVTEVDVDSAPERVYEEVVVAGRSGTILMDMKRYDNVVHSYDVVVYDDYVDNLVALRNDLLSKVGYHTLTDSFNTDEKYLATVYTSITPSQKTQRNGGYLHVEFSRKPQRYLISGETEQTFSSSGSIINPTKFDSRPILVVSGLGILTIGSHTIEIAGTTEQTIYIDCDTMEAWEVVGQGKISRNDYIRNAGEEFPVIAPGSNVVTLGTGITQVKITPRWWRL